MKPYKHNYHWLYCLCRNRGLELRTCTIDLEKRLDQGREMEWGQKRGENLKRNQSRNKLKT